MQQHLQANRGPRERNLFRNLVLVQPLDLPGSYNAAHNHERYVVAQQLESLKATRIVVTATSRTSDGLRALETFRI